MVFSPMQRRSARMSRTYSMSNLAVIDGNSKHELWNYMTMRSSSYKERQEAAFKPYRPPGSHVTNSSHPSSGAGGGGGGVRKGGGGNRRSKLWCETFDHKELTDAEIKRQEAIFELYQGERDLVDDLRMAKQTYRDSMVTLKMMSEEQVQLIFGKLDCLLPLHEDLLARLERGRSEQGRVELVGSVFIDWLPTLSPYDEYCANQTDAKQALDLLVERQARVRDFLQRCLESPFSRKLDLWSYLDLPRTRLVKYPLLLKNILKRTPQDHPDHEHLELAVTLVGEIIARVDSITGERRSCHVRSKLEYLDDKHRCAEVDNSKILLLSGQLKGGKGTKLTVFLFDQALVLTRTATRGDNPTHQVYRQPLPLRHLTLDVDDVTKNNGSFRGGILSGEKATKHSFRVRTDDVTHTLTAADEHDKKQWVNAIHDALNKCKPLPTTNPNKPLRQSNSHTSVLAGNSPRAHLRRSSSAGKQLSCAATGEASRSRSMTVTDGNPVTQSVDNIADDVAVASAVTSQQQQQRRSFSPVVKLRRKFSDRMITKSKLAMTSYDNDDEERRLSRSLTSSPVAYELARSSPRVANGLFRSESCQVKLPPSGKKSRSSLQRRTLSMRSSRFTSTPDLVLPPPRDGALCKAASSMHDVKLSSVEELLSPARRLDDDVAWCADDVGTLRRRRSGTGPPTTTTTSLPDREKSRNDPKTCESWSDDSEPELQSLRLANSEKARNLPKESATSQNFPVCEEEARDDDNVVETSVRHAHCYVAQRCGDDVRHTVARLLDRVCELPVTSQQLATTT